MRLCGPWSSACPDCDVPGLTAGVRVYRITVIISWRNPVPDRNNEAMNEHTAGGRVEEDGLHHLLAQLRTGGPDRGRPHRQGPGRQGPSHVTGLCLREVAADGLLSERRRPHHQPEAAARRRQL